MIKEDNNYYIIKHFPYKKFCRDIEKKYKNSKIKNLVELKSSMFSVIVGQSVRIHKFFIPELLYILQSISGSDSYKRIIFSIQNFTWYKNVIVYQNNPNNIPIKTDLIQISKQMKVELKSYQKDFILEYNKKIIYNLRGYLLAFEQGLGKTLTALALMTSLKKKRVIIICPKSTLFNVWVNHIKFFYKSDKTIWYPGMPQNKKYDFYITNYESMNKLPISRISTSGDDIGIIVDESHNFLHVDSNRTKNLINLSNYFSCNDILLMSGTPLKSIGSEMIPILTILDRKFDSEAKDIFIKSLGLTTTDGIQILRNRLGLMMHRKLKSDVLTLPPKQEIVKKVKIPDGNKYTLDNVKILILEFINKRKKYYSENKKKYINDFNECISYLDNILKDDKDWLTYKSYIEYLSKFNEPQQGNDSYKEIIKWTVSYEKNVLYKLLPSDLKKKFIESKSVIKYVWMKIMGEVIGNLLIKLRSDMTSNIIKYSGLDNIIKTAIKKTLIFTSYVECVEKCEDYCRQSGLNPLSIYGKTSGRLESIISQFKENEDINPLIASIQTLSTGVTLTEANTIVFLNKPWRYSEYSQASDRVHRIGQDTEVFIYTILLDTGNKPNLSTRMEDIMSWSQDMFEGIVGENNVVSMFFK